MQFKYMYEIEETISEYRSIEIPERAPLVDKIKMQPWMNVYDFWWVYKYYDSRNITALLIAVSLLLIAVYVGIRLHKYVR